MSASTVNSALAAHGMGPISTQWGDGDTNADWNLRDMYTDVSTSLPASGTIGFDASEEYNKWEQNQYYVVQGNGAQITATAISAGDVALRVFRAGTMVTEMDYSPKAGPRSCTSTPRPAPSTWWCCTASRPAAAR